MAMIKHIAIATQDVDETAKFYIETFGLKEVGKFDLPIASGYYLSDGNVNLTILNFKNDQVAGVERGKNWTGIHHIGFQVESFEECAQKLTAAGYHPREDINQHLMGAEHRYSGPDGVTFDVSQAGWTLK